MRDIGKNIRDLRTKQNMTQDELAEKLFVTRQTVSNYETGRSRPDVEMLASIAQALNTDPNTLLYGPAPSPNRKPALIRLLLSLALLAAVTAIYFRLSDCASYLASYYYLALPWMWLRTLGKPLVFLIFGWTVMQALSVIQPIPPFESGTARKVRWGLFILLAIYLLITVPFLIFVPAHSGSFPAFAQVWSQVFYFILGVRAGQYTLHGYLICAFLMGILFWLCGFPVRQKASASRETQQ